MSGVRNLKLEVILQAIDKATRPIKAVMQSNKGLAAAVKESRDRLKELNAQQGKIDAFRQLTRDAKETGDKLAAARQKVKELAASMAAAGPPTQQMVRQMQRAEIAVEKLTLANRKKIDAAKAAKSALDAAGISTRQLASHEAGLKSQITATNQALGQHEARLSRVNRQQQQMHAARRQYDRGMETRDKIAGAGAAMSATGAAAGAAVIVPIKEYAQAEDAATQLKVAMMKSGGTVGKEFDRINALAERLGNKLPGTTADFQDMMTMLVRQGMSAQSILGGLGEATAYLGVQLKMPFNEAAEFAAKLQDATRTTEKDMMGLMDVIQRTFYLGVDSNNMLAAFDKLAPAMDTIKQKGLEGAKALAPLVVMADQAGMAGEAAGNAYRKVFQKGMDTGKIKKVLADLKKERGIDLKLNFTDGKGEFAGLPNMFAQLNQLKGLSTEVRTQLIKDLYGDDAEVTQVVSLLIEKGQAGYNETLAKMNAQASLQERVNVQLGTLKNLWDAATGTFTNALVRFGEAIAPEVKALTEWIGNLSERLGAWAKENPGLAGGLMKVAGILAIVLSVMGALTLAAAAVLGPMLIVKAGLAMFAATLGGGAGMIGVFANGFNLLMRVFGGLGGLAMRLIGVVRLLFAVMMANPILAIVTLLAVAAIYVWQNWGTLGPKFAALWDGIKSAAGAAGDWIMQKWNGLTSWFTGLPARFLAIGGQIIDGLMAGIDSKWEALKAKIAGIADSLTGTVKSALGIHSPSRVFAELGVHTMAGLDQGLADGTSGPLSTVMGMAKQLTAAGAGIALGVGTAIAGNVPIDKRPPLASAAPGTAAAASAPSINITIQAAPGMNEQQLAQLVAREIERQQRQQAVRGRSRLGDRD